MKSNLLTYIFIVVTSVFYAQNANDKFTNEDRILLKGKISTGDKKCIDCDVVVNDTIVKFQSLYESKGDWFSKIWDDEKLIADIGPDGEFVIYPRLIDTLYFKARGFSTQKFLAKELATRDSINIDLIPKDCVEKFECSEPQNFLVIIGEKINVEFQEPKKYCDEKGIFVQFDTEYLAEYRILKTLVGDTSDKKIEFTIFDHYSDPEIARYDYSIVYLIEQCGRYFQSKYQFQDLYLTENGEWASPYNPTDYKRLGIEHEIKPTKINFKEPVYYKYHEEWSDERIKDRYPEPYYKHFDGYVEALYGNYIPDLLTIKKETILKARGIKVE